MDPFFLDDVWCLFHHDAYDSNWTYESYVRIATMSSAEDFWHVQACLGPYLTHNMFFVMREHSFPCWDDASNIDGGCVSVRVHVDDVQSYWEQLCAALLCETLAEKEDDANAINGISVSPKHQWCVFKVWLARHISPEMIRLPPGFVGHKMYKTNRDNIKADQSHPA
jgi:hypothetical protein